MKCENESCQEEIVDLETAISIWVEDDSFQEERLAFFCSDGCLTNWWNNPPDNPCAAGDPVSNNGCNFD